MAKFTPGPRAVETPMGDDNPWIVEDGKEVYDWRCLAIVPWGKLECDVPRPEAEANACLIRAAPDLYEAVKPLLTSRSHHPDPDVVERRVTEGLTKGLAALAKAEGR